MNTENKQASRGAGAQSVTVNALWIRSPLEEMKYLFNVLLKFLRSDVEAKCGVEFHHSTSDAGRIVSFNIFAKQKKGEISPWYFQLFLVTKCLVVTYL